MNATVLKSKLIRRRSFLQDWRFWLLALLFLVFCLPLFTVFQQALLAPSDISAHLNQYVLPNVLPNTLFLVLGVTLLSTLLGVSAAWLIAMYEFPGRKFFSWSLMLPMAIPGYVMAFVLLGIFDFTGPLQSYLRDTFGSSDWFPKVRSRAGVIIALSLCLYPYIYLIVRGAFEQQGRRALEVAQSLGHSSFKAVFSLALPLARPWILAGMLLVMMETLADFGAVAIFNYDTFTTAIYKTWYGMDSLPAALRLAAWLMFFVIIVLLIESRNKAGRYHTVGKNNQHQLRFKVTGIKKWLMFNFCLILFVIAFLVPVVQLVLWFLENSELFFQSRYQNFFFNSLTLAIVGASLLATIAVAVIAAQRYLNRRFHRKQAQLNFMGRFMTIGYAIPGTVLAVGLFVPLAAFSGLLSNLGWQTQLLTGSLFALMLGYLIRFFAVAYRPLDSQLQRVSKNVEEMAESFQVTGWQKWKQVMLPLLKPGLITAFILSFVDIMKEMPLTLMTRPFGWDTLATQIFELTSEGEWEKAAIPSLAIVLAGLLPVYLLNKQRD